MNKIHLKLSNKLISMMCYLSTQLCMVHCTRKEKKRKELKIRPTFLPQFQIQCYNNTPTALVLLWYFNVCVRVRVYLCTYICTVLCYDVDERYFFVLKMTNLSCVSYTVTAKYLVVGCMMY